MVPRKVWDSDGKERIANSDNNMNNVRRKAFVSMNGLLQSEANGMVRGLRSARPHSEQLRVSMWIQKRPEAIPGTPANTASPIANTAGYLK